MCKGVGDNGWSGCGMSGRRASCAVRLGFVCMYRRVVRGCVEGQEVGWCIIWRSVGGSMGCVVGGGQRGS